jgi:hypothetical protein|tara:strand:- start:214 stop:1197 length:984 start_codon:yes stop_codon:yes gene_type:complete
VTTITKSRPKQNERQASTLESPTKISSFKSASAPATIRFAKINKNLVIQQDGLGKIIAKFGVTGRDLYFLFGILAEAQKRGSRCIEFRSEYELLKCLDLPVDGQEHAALNRALRVWRNVGFVFGSWYYAEETKGIGYMRKDAQAKLRKKRRAKQTRPNSLANIWCARHRLDGHELTISFSREFWEACELEKFYCKAFLNVIRKLRYPHTIMLALLLDAFGEIKWHPRTIAAKIGLRDTKPSRLIDSIKRAVDAIAAANGENIKFKVSKDGRLRIGKRIPKQNEEPPRETPSNKKSFNQVADEFLMSEYRNGRLRPIPPDPEDSGFDN